MTNPADNEHAPAATDAEAEVDKPVGPRRRFNPRLAMIYTVGAFVIVLAFAVVVGFIDAGRTKAKKSDATDVATMQLGANDGTFTAVTLPPSGLLTMKGEVTDLGEVVDGKPTMLNMFSSSCTACRTEMPDLERLHEAAGDDLKIVGVNLGDSESNAAAFVKQTGVTYPIVRDPKLLLVSALDITAQPMTLWVDPNGKIVGHRYGALTETEMRLAVQDYFGIHIPTP